MFTQESWTRAVTHVRDRKSAGYDGLVLGACDGAETKKVVETTARHLARGTYKPRRARVEVIGQRDKPRRVVVPGAPDALWSRAWLDEFGESVWRQLPFCVVGGRPDSSALGVVRSLSLSLARSSEWVVRFDVTQAFATTAPEVALESLAKLVGDESKMKPVRDWFAKQGAHVEGIAQGFALSPLMFACVLAEHVLPSILPLVEDAVVYIDDGLLVCRDEPTANQIQRLLTERLASIGLGLHPKKTRLYSLDTDDLSSTGFSFLGFTLEHGTLVPSYEAGSECCRAAEDVARRYGLESVGCFFDAWLDAKGVEGPSLVLAWIDDALREMWRMLGVRPDRMPTLQSLAAARAATSGVRPCAPSSRQRRRGRSKKEGRAAIWNGSSEEVIRFPLVSNASSTRQRRTVSASPSRREPLSDRQPSEVSEPTSPSPSTSTRTPQHEADEADRSNSPMPSGRTPARTPSTEQPGVHFQSPHETRSASAAASGC